MKRKIIKREEIDHIIRGSLVCRIGLAANNSPYIVPLSFGYDGKNIFFGFKCNEPQPEKILAKETKHDALVCYDDCIEIFLE